ncbi:HAMP domain-containing sensor histidine kinase [Paenibacillus chitinolyticus]|uniref:sensor histidine kinase n=1 Tax=Paenibacillus chitinolyticus TaxID=79263 RepID=UPI002DBEB94A|nr:HAMP domain-containing sensor histidine kinase [Paenibacillus chitinolyticus]MEC0245306.1 HAMP domain-containing sensor histidine kinase [Paenibacillus chitinolyticus]
MKWRHSLLVKYLSIVVFAMLIWPIIFPMAAVLYYLPHSFKSQEENRQTNPYARGNDIEKFWHGEAKKLQGAGDEGIDKRIRELKEKYPKADLFWVDGSGKTRLTLPERADLPAVWEAADTIAFLKKSYNGDPFTTVAFVGEDAAQGFMVMQIPRALMKEERPIYSDRYVIGIVLLAFALFLFASWLFFYRIRRRLVHLEEAMALPEGRDIPHPVPVSKKDEIGQLELAFNRMIEELTTSRQRERKEEGLRKQLIANLSHDLRTPLTIIRSHAYSLQKEPISASGKSSLALIETKSDDLNRLIDNLLSYTLLSAGKYPLQRTEIDVARLARTSAAAWYPVFEEEGMAMDVGVPEHPVYWKADPQWMSRILDNLFQNVLRHAKSGGYIGLRTEERDGRTALVIEDKGPGMKAPSEEKGAGIGLTIVALMVKEMHLGWDVVSSPEGTAIYLFPRDR